MKKVSVIGAGSWGTALAILLCRNGHDVTLWSIIDDEVQALCRDREHKAKLPGVEIPKEVTITGNMESALQGKDIIVLSVPSPYIRSTAKLMAPFAAHGQIIVNVAKGIEDGTLMPLNDVIEQEIPNANVTVLSGPSHAEEVGNGLPTTCVCGARDKKTAEFVQEVFMSEVFRVYTSPDILGIELGGALKNVIALAAGMADGLGYGDNTKAALITRGITEMARLGKAMGANVITFSGLSGIGDLIVTCESKHSRNRKAGMLIGQGMTMDEAMMKVNMVVEGVYSAKAAKALGEKYQVEMPIVEQVNTILFGGGLVEEAVQGLMKRNRSSEYDLEWDE